MKRKGSIQMKKISVTAIVLSSAAFVMSAAALALGIIAVVRCCAGRRMSASEYNFVVPEEDEEEENIGSDTLAF